MAHRKTLHVHMAGPRVLEPLDAIRGEDQVEIEWAGANLDEILSALDVRSLRICQREREIAKRGDDGPAVGGGFLDEQVRILRRVRKAKKDRA